MKEHNFAVTKSNDKHASPWLFRSLRECAQCVGQMSHCECYENKKHSLFFFLHVRCLWQLLLHYVLNSQKCYSFYFCGIPDYL